MSTTVEIVATPTRDMPAALRAALARISLYWAIALLVVVSPVHAAATVEIIDTYPSGNSVVLKRNEYFYLQVRYSTEHPVHIWIEPYFRGEPARAGNGGSYSYSGDGEVLGWFFLSSSREQVDEVRIRVGDGSRDHTPVLLTYPVQVTGSESLAPPDEPAPEWLARLKELDANRQQQANREYASRPVSSGDSVLASLFVCAMLAIGVGGFVMPLWAFARWRGGWRLTAAVPTALMGFVVLRIVLGVAHDPTSHNLWPFEILMAGLFSVVATAVLLLAHKMARVATT